MCVGGGGWTRAFTHARETIKMKKGERNFQYCFFHYRALTALSVGADDLLDLADDVLNVGGDVADGGVQSLVHLGGQVLDVGDELLHLAEDVDQLEGRAQLGVACRRTQRSQQVESRPLCDRRDDCL